MARANELRPAAASWGYWLVQAGGMGDGGGDCVVMVTVTVVMLVMVIAWS